MEKLAAMIKEACVDVVVKSESSGTTFLLPETPSHMDLSCSNKAHLSRRHERIDDKK